jgi:hypothetical protein
MELGAIARQEEADPEWADPSLFFSLEMSATLLHHLYFKRILFQAENSEILDSEVLSDHLSEWANPVPVEKDQAPGWEADSIHGCAPVPACPHCANVPATPAFASIDR